LSPPAEAGVNLLDSAEAGLNPPDFAEAGLKAFERPGASPSLGHFGEASPAMSASVLSGWY
jgi:hypothetical protein